MATGYFPRTRVRTGYLRCRDPLGLHRQRNESPDRPAEEFRLLKRVYAGKEKHYRTSYCRSCESVYNTETEKARRRADPEYRDRKNRAGNAAYHRNRGNDRCQDRAWRIKQGREAVIRLNAAGWSCERIATETGINVKSLRRWLAGEGRPRDDHILRVRGLVETLVTALTGPLPKGTDP